MDAIEIQLLSDLHLETPSAYDVYQISPSAPYLALLGDIGYVKDSGFVKFLEKQLSQFRAVFLALGNHEPYQSSWAYARSTLRDLEKRSRENPSSGDLIFLDQTRYDLSNTVTVLGCTLFSQITGEQWDHVSFGLNDFYQIENWTVEAHNAAHEADCAWLDAQVTSISDTEPHRTMIVMTHHCPTVDSRAADPRHAKSLISSGFCSDLSGHHFWRNNHVKVWAFGHTHFNCDTRDEQTGMRLVTNQRGYYFAQAHGFREDMIIRL